MNESTYMKFFDALPDEEKALTILWWWNFGGEIESSWFDPELMYHYLQDKGTRAQYEFSIGMGEYDISGIGVIHYEKKYSRREDTNYIFVDGISIDKIIFSAGGPGIKIKEKEKMDDLMSLCFISGLAEHFSAYEQADIRTSKEYNENIIRKKYSSLILNTPPFLFYRVFMDILFESKEIDWR
jgi:hypothetical protein